MTANPRVFGRFGGSLLVNRLQNRSCPVSRQSKDTQSRRKPPSAPCWRRAGTLASFAATASLFDAQDSFICCSDFYSPRSQAWPPASIPLFIRTRIVSAALLHGQAVPIAGVPARMGVIVPFMDMTRSGALSCAYIWK